VSARWYKRCGADFIQLLELGKLHTDNGHLTNARADLEIISAEFQARERAESGSKGGRKRAENAAASIESNDLAQAKLKPIEKRREEKKEEVQASPVAHARPPSFPVDDAVEDWNGAAASIGWPTVQRMSDTRKQAVRNRLRTDGIDGWRAAINRARISPYLGQAPPAWFTFDWFVKPANFLKVIEGNYDRSHAANDRSGGIGPTARAALAAFPDATLG
jgi:hypothetical protein